MEQTPHPVPVCKKNLGAPPSGRRRPELVGVEGANRARSPISCEALAGRNIQPAPFQIRAAAAKSPSCRRPPPQILAARPLPRWPITTAPALPQPTRVRSPPLKDRGDRIGAPPQPPLEHRNRRRNLSGQLFPTTSPKVWHRSLPSPFAATCICVNRAVRICR
jgi:hypothetical protein